MTDGEPGVEAWKRHTTAFDRVRSVATTVGEPRSASWIADEAAVAENTARGHLDRLVELGVLRATEEGVTRYAPDPLHTRTQAIRELLDEYSHDGLVGLKRELQEQIAAWRAEYGVESAAALRECAAETDDAAETRAVRRTANEWELLAYRLELIEDAISNYAAYTRTDTPVEP
ncbi:MAG: ArsR family transcriptional regulator [Halobaculum sp.]